VADVAETLTRVFRADSGRLVGSLVRILGDAALAEDAVQDALVEALAHWPSAGVPDHPEAWLLTAARRKAFNRLKRDAVYQKKLRLLDRLDERAAPAEVAMGDDRLAMLFMCCHHALSRDAQIALTLRAVLGLTTMQIARALLTTDATVTKRIVRAKRRIGDAGLPLGMPSGEELPDRLAAVLAIIYVLFGEGYLATGPDVPERSELARDAEWLASLLLHHMPEEPEVMGLLALIRLHQARRVARFDSAGHLILLKDQDRTLWDRAVIDAAVALLSRAMRQGRPGPYQAQAAIAACHALARSWEDTDWHQIVALYETLLWLGDSPVVRLNRAIALWHCDGAGAALAALEPLADRLSSYHLFHAAKAEMLCDLHRDAEAADENRAAARLTRNPAEVQLLQHRIDGLV
jgi:RNA polymerase sigma-70 factor (ECF subfamily)